MALKEGNETQKSLLERFATFSQSAQKLLISMVPASEMGMKQDAIEYTSGLKGTELEMAISELMNNGMLEQGASSEGKFVTGDGERYRLPPGLAGQVKSEILKI